MDYERVAMLTGTPADEETDNFNHLRGHMVAIRKANPDTRFVYLMGMKDGKLIFLADAEPGDSKDYSAPGDVYPDAKQSDVEDYMAARDMVYEPYTDSWGTWVSGAAYVKDLDQLGMDVDAKDWFENRAVFRLLAIIITLAVSLLSIVLYIAWHRSRE